MENLEQYYDINSGVSNKDCSMRGATIVLEETIDILKQLSSDIYLYLAPTTQHHLSTGC